MGARLQNGGNSAVVFAKNDASATVVFVNKIQYIICPKRDTRGMLLVALAWKLLSMGV